MNIIIPKKSININTFNMTGGNKKSNVNYPMVLKTNFSKISPEKGSKIFICVYRICKSSKKKIIYKEFLQYLLYKINDDIIFPFKIYREGTPLTIANKLVKTILQKNIKCDGYLTHSNNYYFFYNNPSSIKVQKISIQDNYWWALIDEICNHNKIVNLPILPSCYTLFYKNPSLIYLKKGKKNIDIPVVAFFGDTIEMIPYTASLGLRSSPYKTFGPYYYFTNYIKSIHWGSFTSNYKDRTIFNKKVTNNNGKYVQGGIIRFALFLDDYTCLLYNKNNMFYNLFDYLDNNILKKQTNKTHKQKTHGLGEWTEKYDSIILGNIKYNNLSGYFNINTEYILKNFEQQISLSTHEIDKNTVKPNWDPLYQNYYIK